MQVLCNIAILQTVSFGRPQGAQLSQGAPGHPLELPVAIFRRRPIIVLLLWYVTIP